MNTNPATRLRAAAAPSPEFPRTAVRAYLNPFRRAFPLPALPPLDLAIIAVLIIGGLFLRLVVLETGRCTTTKVCMPPIHGI